MPDLPAGCCSYCGAVNRESAPIIGPDQPEPGTIMICECSAVSLYVGDGQARRPTDDEWLTLKDDPEIILAQFDALMGAGGIQ